MSHERFPTDRRPAPALAAACAVTIVASLATSLTALGSNAPDPAGPTDEAVTKHIDTLRDRLIGSQRPGGAWDGGGRGGGVGVTALATLALKYSGLPNDHPTIVRAMKFLNAHRSKCVYSEGLVPCVIELVDPVKHRARLLHSLNFLMRAQQTNGGWGYTEGRGYYDNSCTQFAVLGIAAAQRCGLPSTPEGAAQVRKIQDRTVKLLLRTQSTNGGWGYRGTSRPGSERLSMTCAGIASLHLFGERLEQPTDTCGVYKTNKAMQRALGYLGTLLNNGLNADGYTLYALERVGVFMDLRLIGGNDWYRMGATSILAEGGRGGWGGQAVGDSFSLLFLAKGSAPIAIAKWCWKGDWNNDHGDVREWVNIASEELGGRYDWWECRLDDRSSAAANASMIFVNGHDPFDATGRELETLRRFLMDKGTLVAEGCCDSRIFVESFKRTVVTRLFPGAKAKFVPVDASHPVCSAVHRLDPDDVGALKLTMGCRQIKMIVLNRDISCALNGEDCSAEELRRAQQVATNLLAWALVTRKPKGKLTRAKLEPPLEDMTVDQLKRRLGVRGRGCRLAMGRLVHRGEWDVDGCFFAALKDALRRQSDVPTFERELCIAPTSDDLFHVPFLFMTGHENPGLRQNEYLHLRSYLQNGGFMLVSCCCGRTEFDTGFRELVRRLLPNDELERIPPDDPLWHTPHDCTATDPGGTKSYREEYGKAWAPMYGVRRDGRWVLVYSPVDFCCSLGDDLMDGTPAYGKAASVKFVINCIHRAFSP